MVPESVAVMWRVVTCVGALVLAVLLLPEAAFAGWVPVGGRLSASGVFSGSPAITTVNGTAFVAWVEDTGPNAEVRVAEQTGSGWTQRPNPMDDPATNSAEQIDIAPVNGLPMVAFAQKVGGNPEIRVKAWNGTAWIPRGPALNVGPTSGAGATFARDPKIVGHGTQPCVTWWEGPAGQAGKPGGNVYVKCYNGSNWGLAIGGSLKTTATENATTPSITEIGGVLYVAWTEVAASEMSNVAGDEDGGTVFVRRLNGASWTPVGQPLQVAAGNLAHHPDLADVGGTPYVAWEETDPDFTSSQFAAHVIHVSRFNGLDWDNGFPSSDTSRDSRKPVLANIGGIPHVADSEADAQGSANTVPRSVRVRKPDQNGFWTALEALAPIRKQPQHDAAPGGLTAVGGMPYVAFVSGGEIWVSRWFISVRNTAPPYVTGTGAVGQTLTCNQGTWFNDADNQPLGYQYWWESGARNQEEGDDVTWSQINDSDGNQYTVRPEDAGGRVRCRVFAQNQYDLITHVSQSVRTDAGPALNTVRPRIEGSAISGTPHTCIPGEWSSEATYTYRWLIGGSVVPLATNPTYTPPRIRPSDTPVDDAKHELTCEVTARNGAGASSRATSDQVYVVDGVPLNYNSPVVIGDVPDANPAGHEVTCSPGVWIDDYPGLGLPGFSYEYQWQRNDADIAGATGSTYTTTVDDLGSHLTCVVSTANPAGRSAPKTSVRRPIPLPFVTSQGEMQLALGPNEYVPINMMALGREYKFLVDGYLATKFGQAKMSETQRCNRVYAPPQLQQALQRVGQLQVGGPVDDLSRCALLVYAGERINAYPTGLEWVDKCVGRRSNFINGPTTTECLDLGVAIPPVDPSKPPPLDFPDQARLASVTPVETLWDVDNDGFTDVTCPGTAPVLRTMLNRGQWNPRAIIVYPNSAVSGVYSEARTPGAFTNPPKTAGSIGQLRNAQPLMCRTSLEQPPEPKSGPCITDGKIGRVRVVGNLCPISIRTMTQAQIDNIRIHNNELIDVLEKFALDAERKESNRPRNVVYFEQEPNHLQPRGFGEFTRRQVASFENAASSRAGFNESGDMDGRYIQGSTIAPGQFKTLKQGGQSNFTLDQMYISTGGMKVNGVTVEPTGPLPGLIIPTEVREGFLDQLKPAANMKILVEDAKTRLGDFVLSKGKRIEAEFKDSATEAVKGLLQSDFTNLFDDIADYKIGPFSLGGKIDVKLNQDQTATITAQAKLPLFTTGPNSGDLTADVVLSGDREGNIKLESIELRKDHAYLFGIELDNLFMRYDPGGLTITGSIQFGGRAGPKIDIVYFHITPKPELDALEVDFTAPSGTGIAVGPGVFLIGLHGGYKSEQQELIAGSTFAIGPNAGGCPAFGLDGEVHISWLDYVRFYAVEDIVAACIPLAKITFDARSTGYVSLSGGVHFRAGKIFLDGGIAGSFDAGKKFERTSQPLWQLELDARGGVKDVPIVGDVEAHLSGALSNRGLAVCAGVKVLWEDVSAGGGIKFINGIPPITFPQLVAGLRVFTGCDLSGYKTMPSALPPFRAHAAQASSGSFEVSGGQRGIVLSFDGLGDPPRLRLGSPTGKTYDFTDAVDGKLVDDAWGVMIEDEDRTVVLIKKPPAGRWTVELGEGSPRLMKIERSDVLPKPQVRGTVGGIGSSRVLKYRVRRIPGQEVRLVEDVNGAHRQLRLVKGGGKGTIRFRTAEATGTRRRILAEVTQDGLPRDTIVVARLTAPSPKVGPPKKLRVRRRGSTAVVTWRKAVLAERYDVVVQAGDGGRSLLAPSGRRLTVTVPGVTKNEGLVVRVVGISPAGRRGKAAKARLKGSLKLGAAKREKPRRPKRKRRRRG